MTPKVKYTINLLIKTRKVVGVPEENPLIFARPNRQSLDHRRAWDCLLQFAMEGDPPLSNPTNIGSTKLRECIATISQVPSLNEKEVDWLARHLGHDIQVHGNFYRLHKSTVEIANVSKLLLTIDRGETRKFAGKTLAEIELNDWYKIVGNFNSITNFPCSYVFIVLGSHTLAFLFLKILLRCQLCYKSERKHQLLTNRVPRKSNHLACSLKFFMLHSANLIPRYICHCFKMMAMYL